MVWYHHMFLGKKCRARANRLKYKISNRLMHTGVYLVVLSDYEQAILEIIPSILLLQQAYPVEELRIIGMAATRQEAFSLIEEIIGIVYKRQGNVDVSAYMEQLG